MVDYTIAQLQLIVAKNVPRFVIIIIITQFCNVFSIISLTISMIEFADGSLKNASDV